MTRVADRCTDGRAHQWTEWRYSEEAAGAVRHCITCAMLINRVWDVIGAHAAAVSETTAGSVPATVPATVPDGTTDTAPATPALTVFGALGASFFAEELRGNFVQAGAVADAGLVSASTPAENAEALLLRGVVHLLQGNILHAQRLLHESLTLAGDDINHRLRTLSYLLDATHHQYNLFPDRCGVGSEEVSTRWGGAKDLLPMDTQWNEALSVATGGAAQFEAWLTYGFGSQLLPSRYMLDTRRFAPSDKSLAAVLGMATSRTDRLRHLGSTLPWPSLCAYADLVEADLQRRAGDGGAAAALLERAQTQYRDGGDSVGVALCIMTRADWATAAFSTPLSWNFALVDSSGSSSSLSVPLESVEAIAPTASALTAAVQSYAEAAALFDTLGAPRGMGAVSLRLGYVAALGDDWDGAAAHATEARTVFREAGDHLHAQLASTHLLMAVLSGASTSIDTTALATEIGAWGQTSGSFSFALGCGVLVNRLARHWLIRRGHCERALRCSAAARTLFEALGARINAAQSLVDAGLMHKAVGNRGTALTCFEQALDEYAQQADQHPRVASNLRQRIVLLATDVYQLALQDTDSDGMERSAARLSAQLRELPTSTNLQDAMLAMQARMAAMLAGSPVEASEPQNVDELMTLAPLGELAASVVRNAAVLAPLYRSRAASAAGDTRAATALIAQAQRAVPFVREGERDMLHAVVLAEQDDFTGAANAMRAYLHAGGANSGLGGDIARVLQQAGGEHAEAELRLQVRRTHEQAFTAFVMVRAYDDAAQHLASLEAIAGADWWKGDGKPWQSLCDMAELFEHRGDSSRARECYAQAVEQLEQRRAFLSRDELKVALASDKGAQYVYLLAARAAVKQGDAAGGFRLAERAKSRALLDLMAVSREPVPGAEMPELRRWREQGMQLQLTLGLLAQARAQHKADPARVAMLEQQVRDVESAHRDAERAVAAVYPRFQQAVSATASVLDADGVQRLLPPGTLLLEYFFVGEVLLAWAVPADAAPVAHHATFDTNVIMRDVRALHQAIAPDDPVTGAPIDPLLPWQPVAERLAAQLLVPFAAQIAASADLLIVPHGAAHLLPFHVLPVNGAMLADRHSVSYLPSASVLQWLTRRDTEVIPENILVVGNPTLDLPASRREAQFVAEQFPGATLLLEGDATEAAVRNAVPGMLLVHFATHGILDEATPLNSRLLLANGDALTVYELMLLRLQARLVVLSACSTGQGETTGGDDVLGLTRALLAAGAEAAVVSLWKVDDASTAIFMQAFYAEIVRGMPPRHALRTAQVRLRLIALRETEVQTREARRSQSAGATVIPDDEGDYRHPYFWAPFILVGR